MKKDIKTIIKYTLEKLNMYSEDAADLVFKTGMAESGYRVLLQKGGGPAVGFFQCEPATIEDTWINYAAYRPDLKTKLWGLGYDESNLKMSVMSSIALQVAFCRLKYRRDKYPLPNMMELEKQAKYWKRVYNSELGKGTVEHFIKANNG